MLSVDLWKRIVVDWGVHSATVLSVAWLIAGISASRYLGGARCVMQR